MTGKRRKVEYSKNNAAYVNIGLKNNTHRALGLLAGSRTFDTFIKQLLIHAVSCRDTKIKDVVLLNNDLLGQLAKELK